MRRWPHRPMSPTARCWPISWTRNRPARGGIRPTADSGRIVMEPTPKARDFTNRPSRHRGVVDEVELAKSRTESKVRAKVEHSIVVIKRAFGFAKVRYRGLKKNAHRLLVTCALANLFMVRRHLLRCQAAECVRNR